MSIADKIVRTVEEKNKNNEDQIQKDMKILDMRKDKIRNLERKFDDFERACEDLHGIERELGIDLNDVKSEIIEGIRRALR